MRFTGQQIAEATGGRLLRDAPAGRICTDTRQIEPGDWFVALRGPRFDGHDYLRVASERGAVGAVVMADVDPPGGAVRVDDTTAAYGRLGLAARRRLRCPVVGLTGTSGKTTTRALIALALRPLGHVHQTQANLNNHLGVPLTLLASPAAPAVVVLEMGTSGPGEIAHLAALGEPSHRLVLNVGHGHLEELGDLDGVGAEKRSLITTARPGDVAFVNLDDPRVRCVALPPAVRCVTFGQHPDADIRILGAELDAAALRTRVGLRVDGANLTADLPVFGHHFASNVAAAIAVATTLGVPAEQAVAQLGDYAPVGMRQRITQLTSGLLLINDAYNANPESMAAGLRTLAALPGPRVALLGDMLELGAHEVAAHRGILDLLRELGIDRALVVGPRFGAAVAASGSAVLAAPDSDRAVDLARDLVAGARTALVKGSRGLRLERIVQGLAPDATEAPRCSTT